MLNAKDKIWLLEASNDFYNEAKRLHVDSVSQKTMNFEAIHSESTSTSKGNSELQELYLLNQVMYSCCKL